MAVTEEKKKQAQQAAKAAAELWKNGVGAQKYNAIDAAIKNTFPELSLPKNSFMRIDNTSSSKNRFMDTVNTGSSKNGSQQTAQNTQQRPTYTPTSAEKMQKKKEDRLEKKNPVDSAEIKKKRAEQNLRDFDENADYDWTDANSRKAYDAERKRLQSEVDKAGAEIDARADAKTHEENMDKIAAMSTEDRDQLQQYIESRDARRSVFVNDITRFQEHKKETENKNALVEKYGEEQLEKLAETYGRYLHEQKAKEETANAQEAVNKNWMSAALSNIAAIPARALGGIEAAAGRLYEQADRTGQYRTLEEHTPGDLPSLYGNAVTAQTAQNIAGEDGSAGRQILSYGYQGLMSIADTVARGFLGGGSIGGASLAATSSFAQTMSDATQRGATPAQAALLATVTSGIEYATEKVPLDSLIKASSGKSGLSVLLNVLRQAGIEAGEEELSLLGSVLADAAVMQEKSEYKQSVSGYMDGGFSEEQAKAEANRDLVINALETYIVSSIAGGIGGFGAAKAAAYGADMLDTGVQNRKNTQQDQQTDAQQPVQAMRAPDSVDPNTGLHTAGDTNAALAQTAADLAGMIPMQETQPIAPGMQNLNAAIEETLGVQPAQKSAVDNMHAAESTKQTDTLEASVEDGRQETKGTMAAEQNFSGKAKYKNLLSAENAQRNRNTGARPVEIPKVDGNGNRVTEFAGNVYSAKVTPDSTANAVKSLIQDGKLGFDTRSNQQSLENARQAILDNGHDTIRREIASNAENNVIRDGDIEKAMVLYAAYANDPKMQDEASGLIVDMGKLANMSGRNLQMFSLIQRMTPEGQMMAVRKNVSRYIDDINRTRNGRKKVAYEISQELENQYIYAKTDGEKQEALNAIYEDVASGIKPTLGEAWDAWRNLSMLGNPITHERNIVSTAAWQPFVEVKRDIGAAIEAVVLRKKRDQRTKAILGLSENDWALLKWAKADAKTQSAKKLMEGPGRTGNEAANEIQKYRKLLPGPLDKLSKGNMDLMGAEDSIFKSHEYSRSLASFLKARGYTYQQLQNGEVPVGVLDLARQHAVQEAKKATFNDQNEFSKQFSNMLGPKANSPAILNVIKKANTPYLRTPANIVHRAWEFSPYSLGKTLLTAKSDIDSGRMSASDVIDRVSSGLAGTAAMGLGSALSAGIIPGVRLIAEPTEEEKMEGAVPYSIEIGEKYYPAGWLAPTMIPLFTGARLNENLSRAYGEDGEINGWDVVQAVADSCAHSLDPILDLSVLSSLKRVLEEVGSYGDFSDKIISLTVGSTMEYLSQGIPVLFGQLEKAFEPEKKSVYVNTDRSIEKTVKKTIGNATKRIPGIDLYQTTKLDDAGNPVTPEGDALTRAMEAMFSPITVSEKSIDPVTKEMARLNKTPDIDIKPKNVPKTVSYQDKNGDVHTDVRISEDQYSKWSSAQKKAGYRITSELVSSNEYKNLTDLQKAKALELAQEYAADQGKRAVLDDYPAQSGWMAGIGGKEADAIVRKVNADALNRAMEDLTTAWKNGWDDRKGKSDLDSAYTTLGKMSEHTRADVLTESSATIRHYAEARDAGISNQKYVWILKQKSIAEKEKGGELNQGEKIKILSDVTGLSDSQKELLFKADVSDTQDENIDQVKALVEEYGLPQSYLKLYAEAYDIAENYTKGKGKKNRTISRLCSLYGIRWDAAKAIYEVFK